MKTGVRKRIMPSEWIEPLIRQAAELGVKEIIPTTMGDPLVSKNFESILEHAKTHGLMLNVTHNGTFPLKGAVEWARQICPVTSDIKISWNGSTAATAEFIMKGIKFGETIANLRSFIAERDRLARENNHYCSVTLQLTFMTLNLQEIPSILKMAAELGIDRVKGHHLWTHFPEIEEWSLTNSLDKIALWNAMLHEIKLTVDALAKQYVKIPRLEGFFPINLAASEGVPFAYSCPFLGKELWISAEGMYSPCCAPDEERKSLGYFGKYPERTIQDVLLSPEYQWLMSHYKSMELCKKCKMRKPIINETN